MPIPFRAPDVIARSYFALVIDEAALDDKSLFDLDMLVQRELGARLPAEKRRHQPSFRLFEQDLHIDSGTRRRLPRQAVDLDIVRG
jgi:hypothetical protein